MISSLKIRNFRSFENLDVSNLKTLNVLLGRNASGKTALMEALFLGMGNGPELAQRLRGWRQLPIYTNNHLSIDRENWSDLFNNLDTAKPISIDIQGGNSWTRRLKITYDTKDTSTTVAPGLTSPFPLSPIKFAYKDSRVFNSKEQIGRAVLSPGEMQFPDFVRIVETVTFFTSQSVINNLENVDRYSTIARTHKRQNLIDLIQSEFEFVNNVEVLTQFGVPTVCVSIKGQTAIVPLGLVSSGFNKIIGLLMAVAANPNGIIIIDEIENGIYYERYPALWRGLYQLAVESNVQLFVSTHSFECLQALSSVAGGWENNVSFIRFSGMPARVEQFHGKSMFGALGIGEVR